jgi:hypothetical protein
MEVCSTWLLLPVSSIAGLVEEGMLAASTLPWTRLIGFLDAKTDTGPSAAVICFFPYIPGRKGFAYGVQYQHIDISG